MNRPFALASAFALAAAGVSATTASQPADLIHFSLKPQGGDETRIRATFGGDRGGSHENVWSTGFRPSELTGLEVSSFRAAGTRPLHFALVREAGRLDCAGNGGSSFAAGNCRFTADPAFTQLIVSRGIGRPTRDQSFALMGVNARRAMLDAIAAARYPTPRLDDVIALSALGADGRYIAELARVGYRPGSISSLIEFKALDINPEWIGRFTRVGYANIPANELVQLRALHVTPEFIAGFQQIGYGNLPVNKLVELKALDITPEFVRSMTRANGAVPPVNELAELKIFGRKR